MPYPARRLRGSRGEESRLGARRPAAASGVDPPSGVRDLRSGVRGPGSGVLRPGSGVFGLRSGDWVWGPGAWVQGFRSGVRGLGLGSWGLGPVSWDLGPGSWVCSLRSGDWVCFLASNPVPDRLRPEPESPLRADSDLLTANQSCRIPRSIGLVKPTLPSNQSQKQNRRSDTFGSGTDFDCHHKPGFPRQISSAAAEASSRFVVAYNRA